MKLSDIFSEFKTISPDPQYVEQSKRAILASPQELPARERGIMVFFRSLETGMALVLAGFFILLATGSFSGNKYLAPVQYSVIDPNGLHAEAQAIDIQIQLANLDYSEVTSTAESTTSSAAGTTKPSARPLTIKKSASSGAAASGASSTSTAAGASSTATGALSVDQALQALSQ